MTKCIGCKCCVVACNEQNGNPADILWRRVGEIEGGSYPFTQRHYLSIGCNHCLEPTCMTGCPVDAYSKDGLTGIVSHSADACIGCQYCTWNCSYGVPQYNPERGVVGKCDMCYGRLERGQSPACVSACPENAIQIELVNIADWRTEYKPLANSPGMPSADDSLSTTRITLPKSAPGDLRKVDITHLRIEHAHWPLIFMTVLTQLSVGVFGAIAWMQLVGRGAHDSAALIALVVALAALSASTLHLGRPIYAARAMKMWRRSWLSREVLLFTLFAAAATIYSAALFFRLAGVGFFGVCTVLLGACGVAASARLYLAPGRPAWNSPITFLEFFATTFLLGVSAADALSNGHYALNTALLLAAVAVAAAVAVKLLWLRFASRHELFASWQLLSSVLLNKLLLRAFMLIVGVSFIVAADSIYFRTLGLLLLLGGEFIGRYLFFVSVVPSNIASGYLAQEAA
ncbi:DmsC/YnfH family molybdoenzyme membrane anchor subunit [Occallatibacter riparius]|uniref:Dimethyl sulfoxide reductase anchor subunit n=1 Tax=Occallatibacter riparius TaxID=1002689 RepID=A0A9J7BZ80_9BACT|nr:DmsC/YnfH family molybdoenzyme membrane anchor subunit [Occallatibacter riparius]UWZ86910.1 dimethyl sulfoxide reductase anchor subunit [Occallatibacter riparius]